MKSDKGFVLVAVLVTSVVVFVLGVAGMYISQIGYASISAEQRFQIAEKNANYALMKATTDILSGTITCGDEPSYSAGVGNTRVRTLQAGNSCFIWAEGTFGPARVVKVNVVSTGGGADVAALVFNTFSGTDFSLKNKSEISSGGSDCPAISYEDCGPVCGAINDYIGCSRRPSWQGCIDGDVNQLAEALNPEETFLKEDIESIKKDLLNEFERVFNEATERLPTPPEVTDSSCVLSGVSECRIKFGSPNTIVCDSSVSVNASLCPGGVKIQGSTVTIDFWQGNIPAPIVVEAKNIERIDIGQTTIEGGLYVIAENVDCGDECVTLNLSNSSVIRGDVYIRAQVMDEDLKLSNTATIDGNLYVILSETAEEAELDLELANTAEITGNVYFRGYEFEVELSNSTGIGGNIIAKATHEAEFELANNSYINGSIYAYGGEELEIESVNSSKFGTIRNLLLTEGELEIELANNAEQSVGIIAWVGNDLANSEAEIELANNTYIKGFILVGNLEELNLPNKTRLEGALIAQRIGDDGLKLSNSASIRGILISLEGLNELNMSNKATIEGVIFANSITDKLELADNSQLVLNVELVNQLINDFGLSKYFKELKCEGTGLKVATMFKMGVY